MSKPELESIVTDGAGKGSYKAHRWTHSFNFKSTPKPKPKVWTVKMWGDGRLTCNCPAWIFPKKGQPRGCKHAKAVEEFLKGAVLPEELPMLKVPLPKMRERK